MRIMSYEEVPAATIGNKGLEELYESATGFVKSFPIHPGGECAFTVDLRDDDAVVFPHFHDVDQFQVVIRGTGKLGAADIRPISFHYADAYTPYGPITGRKDGVEFFTLRSAQASGFYPVPKARSVAPCKPGRNLAGVFEHGPRPAPGECARSILVAQQPDGVAVYGIRLGAGARFEDDGSLAGGRYYVVCGGALEHAGRRYPLYSLAFAAGDEAPPDFRAGPEGAEVLVMQLPLPSARYASDPKNAAHRVARAAPPP